jgi:hypothetical protein
MKIHNFTKFPKCTKDFFWSEERKLLTELVGKLHTVMPYSLKISELTDLGIIAFWNYQSTKWGPYKVTKGLKLCYSPEMKFLETVRTGDYTHACTNRLGKKYSLMGLKGEIQINYEMTEDATRVLRWFQPKYKSPLQNSIISTRPIFTFDKEIENRLFKLLC